MNKNKHENSIENKHLKKRKRKPLNTKKIAVILCVLFGAVLFMLSPVFTIKNIEITTMDKYSKDELCDMLNLKTGTNMFLFNRFKASKVLKNNNYVDDYDISYKFPDTIKIDITERKVRGYVPYMGSYLYIDEYGRVLEINSQMSSALPVVEGLKFDTFVLGEKINAENKEAFDIMVTIAQLMNKYELLDIVVKIDVSDINKVTAFVNNIEVNLGDMSNGDQKIRTMGEVVKNLGPNDRGVLDLSDLSKPIVFKYLT